MTPERLEQLKNEIWIKTTDICHRAYMMFEGRELPDDANNSVKDLEELTRFVSELYGISGAKQKVELRPFYETEDLPKWMQEGMSTCITGSESMVLLKAYDEMQRLRERIHSPHSQKR